FEGASTVQLQEHRAADSHQAGYRAHRNVNAATYHYNSHSERDNYERRVQVEKVKECLELQEAARVTDYRNEVHEYEDPASYQEQQVRVRNCFALLWRQFCYCVWHVNRSHLRPPSVETHLQAGLPDPRHLSRQLELAPVASPGLTGPG